MRAEAKRHPLSCERPPLPRSVGVRQNERVNQRLLSHCLLIWSQPDSAEDHRLWRDLLAQCLQGPTPAKIFRQVFRRDAMEATQPFFQPAMVGIDVVEMEIRRLGVGLPGIGRTWVGIAARRAKATIAVPPSQQNWLAEVTTPPSAAAMETRFNRGSTASVVAPSRSRATITGICSADRPRLADLPPRLRDFRGMPDRLPLNDSRMNVSSPSTIPVNALGLSPARAARNRCLQRNAVV